METLTNKTAVVLGASGSSNFGSVIARRLAKEGANVVVAARRREPLEALAEEIGGLAVACDVTEEAEIAGLFEAASAKYGNVDIAVNSAGILSGDPISELSAEKIRPTLEISFIGALLYFKHAAAAMQNGGSVITISSLTARIPGPQLAVYAGARAGIDYSIKVAALEYAEKKIRFNSIAAGLIQTDMTDGFFALDAIIDAHLNDTPAGRMGTVNDMAEAALFLADESRSGFINGQVLDLSGGQQMGHLPRF
ncbi:SDR family NAD(P)-dependent oxidoreductase [Biformimicrobium ophioploci]|uniref:SDR family NAD(P)-dependent oxidoreductase n=1 Tax=Biformimicrobium ophioploci TaxID=3036711 RepID=A0ABQ6M289_9GAMM|nr:SDR family oxidoreductase [Microbulbifer sp. NKW57]GMG88385.1 SDR family NAD(P)-dependent oxidoreductase [Microbulbifer sp. NKW57]